MKFEISMKDKIKAKHPQQTYKLQTQVQTKQGSLNRPGYSNKHPDFQVISDPWTDSRSD